MYLSKNIRYLRKKKNLSQESLADKFGYKSFTTIQKWEMGTSEPPAGVVKDLADFFDVDIDALMKTDLESLDLNPDSHNYYVNNETKELAEFLHSNPDYKILFDAARDSRPEDLKMAADLLLRLKGTNPDG